MRMLARLPAAVAAITAALLPHRHWRQLPYWIPVQAAAFPSGLLTFFLGAAIGIPGFLEHAGATVSLANETVVAEAMRNPAAGYSRGMVQGFAGLSIFTFLFLTPKGLLTLYLLGSGGARAAAAWFDDPIGDPLLTGIDHALHGTRDRRSREDERRTRETLEGPEIADRAVSSAAAGLPECDLVIVASRRKVGWDHGVTVFTADAAYRIGQPVERTIAGRLRTLYPLIEHKDFEAVRKSVHYDLPVRAGTDGGVPGPGGRTTGDRSA
jgi:hypothetical protein